MENDNTQDPRNEGTLSDLSRIMEERITYRYDLFVSYSSGQEDTAMEIFEKLSQTMAVFYAPQTLKQIDHIPNQYVEVLSESLMKSCRTIVLLSQSYIGSAWCQLELYGYFNLFLEDNKRRLWIVPIEKDIEKELPGQFVPLLCDLEHALEAIQQSVATPSIKPGDRFADRNPPQMFLNLPLYELYEPPGRTRRPPWGKDSRSPHGVPGAPPYAIYQQMVREYMVQLRRYGDDLLNPVTIELSIPMIGVDERYAYMKDRAKADARYLNSFGLSPYSGSARLDYRRMFYDCLQKQIANQMNPESDCMEGFARVCMGNVGEGIETLRTALPLAPASVNAFYRIELARAQYLDRDFGGALATLEQLDHSSPAERLILAACRARLGTLSAREKDENRNSSVRLDVVRMHSLLEDRNHLEFWIEGLERAGFQR